MFPLFFVFNEDTIFLSGTFITEDSTWKPKLALLSSWGAGSFFMPETGSWKPHIYLSLGRQACCYSWFYSLLVSTVGLHSPGAFVKSRFASEVLAVAWEPAFPADVAVALRQ